MLRVLTGIEHDFDRNPLYHLDVVAGRVLRRQQGKARARRAGDAVDFAVVGAPAVRVDVDPRPLTRPHVAQLRLLEVRRDPDFVDLHDGQQRLPGLHDLAGVDPFLRDDAAHRRLDGGVLEVELGLRDIRARLQDVRFGGRRARLDGGHLLAPRLRRLELRARLLLTGARLRQLALGDADAG